MRNSRRNVCAGPTSGCSTVFQYVMDFHIVGVGQEKRCIRAEKSMMMTIMMMNKKHVYRSLP